MRTPWAQQYLAEQAGDDYNALSGPRQAVLVHRLTEIPVRNFWMEAIKFPSLAEYAIHLVSQEVT